jgi:hypothetical protein
MSDFNIEELIKIWQPRAVNSLLFVLKKWYLLLLAGIAGGATGYYSNRDSIITTYTANITFVLSTEQRGGGGLSGLVAQIGFDGNSGGSENIFSGDNIIEFFKSRSLIGAALMSEVDTSSHQTLLNYIAQTQHQKIFKKIGPFGRNPHTYSKEQTGLYRNIIGYVGHSFTVYKKDKKLIFYIISATSTDQNAAYYIAKCMLKQTSRYFIQTKTDVAATSVSLLKHEADSLSQVLHNAYNSTAEMIDRTYNLNPSVSIQRSGTQFNQARAAAISSAYVEVMRSLEIAKINLQKETPLYRIIDEPELPLPAYTPSIVPSIVKFSVLGFLLAAVLLVILRIYYINHKKIEYDN